MRVSPAKTVVPLFYDLNRGSCCSNESGPLLLMVTSRMLRLTESPGYGASVCVAQVAYARFGS